MNNNSYYYNQRQVYSIYILLLFIVIPFFIKDYIEDSTYIEYINYCSERQEYSMVVFDSIKSDSPLSWWKEDWHSYPPQYDKYIDRERWWSDLAFEVNGLMGMGMLSFRIKEAVYQTCLDV
tara:strand:- start:558 stop:920 length:363 start_codon:yes stop_codon:yes gene_type:complete